MGRQFNASCVTCGVLKDDTNTARTQARGGNGFDSYCRECRKRARQQWALASSKAVKQRRPRDSGLVPARRVTVVPKEVRELRKRLDASKSFRRFEDRMKRLGVALTERLECDPSLATFKVTLRRYEVAQQVACRAESDRLLAETLRRVADQPHAPWLNVIACRECMRELNDSITYALGKQNGNEGDPPRECRERIEAQARGYQRSTSGQEAAALDEERNEEDWRATLADRSHREDEGSDSARAMVTLPDWHEAICA